MSDPFRSHLGGGSGGMPEGQLDRVAHGRVVAAKDIPEHTGGSRGVLSGAPDPRVQPKTEVGLPAEARNWRGSATQFTEQELPQNDMHGRGMAGTGKVFSAAEMDARDRAEPTHPDVKPLQPGAYKLANGNVLVVYANNTREVMSMQQFQAWYAQKQREQQTQQRIAKDPALALLQRMRR